MIILDLCIMKIMTFGQYKMVGIFKILRHFNFFPDFAFYVVLQINKSESLASSSGEIVSALCSIISCGSFSSALSLIPSIAALFNIAFLSFFLRWEKAAVMNFMKKSTSLTSYGGDRGTTLTIAASTFGGVLKACLGTTSRISTWA